MPRKPVEERPQLAMLKRQAAQLRRFALRFPQVIEEHPWGECAFKVNKKVFTFLSVHKNILHVTTKLPETGEAALSFPFAAPTGYGLGKSGWVTARFEPGDHVPVELIQEWIGESYRAIASAKLKAAFAGQRQSKKKHRLLSRRKKT